MVSSGPFIPFSSHGSNWTLLSAVIFFLFCTLWILSSFLPSLSLPLFLFSFFLFSSVICWNLIMFSTFLHHITLMFGFGENILFFPLSSQFYWGIIDKYNCIYCTVQWFDRNIYCGMTTKIKIINTSITYENILDFNIEVILLGENNAKQKY